MKKVFLFAGLLACMAFFSECAKKKTDDAVCLTNDPNPNKSSELAILMRQMANHAEGLKKEVLAGHVTGAFPEGFRKIHTAVPSDSLIRGDAFDMYATGYLNNLSMLYSSPPDLREQYNAVINTCVACHNQSCPGPLVRIKKMLL